MGLSSAIGWDEIDACRLWSALTRRVDWPLAREKDLIASGTCASARPPLEGNSSGRETHDESVDNDGSRVHRRDDQIFLCLSRCGFQVRTREVKSREFCDLKVANFRGH